MAIFVRIFVPVAVCWSMSQHVELVEAVQNTQRQTTHVKHGLTVHLLIDSSLTSLCPAPSKLQTSPSPIANDPSLNASLMNAVKDFNGGKHVARRRKMLWVEEGRGE